MTNLDCSVISCTYNTDNSCKKDGITVGGHDAHKPSETACKSFAPKTMHSVTNLASCHASKQTEVACDAVHCKFNEDKKCRAKHIGIAGAHAVTNGETECGSFENR